MKGIRETAGYVRKGSFQEISVLVPHILRIKFCQHIDQQPYALKGVLHPMISCLCYKSRDFKLDINCVGGV